MHTRADEVIEHVKKMENIDDAKKEAIITKIQEWKTDKNAQNNSLAVTFEKFWMELEPIFAEMGWV